MFASKTIRRFAAGMILLTCAAATAPGQSSGLSPLAQAAMERALRWPTGTPTTGPWASVSTVRG